MSDANASQDSARIPISTYRVQLTKDFNLRKLIEVVDYLSMLGVSDVYISPFLVARPGSQHGYDVVDHRFIDPELGNDDVMAELQRELAARGMGLIADVVPNHMCVNTNDNAWWNDVLENGPSSRFAKYFDIEWHPPKEQLRDKVLLPVLGNQYGRVLENAELQLREQAGAFAVNYGDRRFPISPGTYSLILRGALERLEESAPDERRVIEELESIMTAADRLPDRSETSADKVRERQREKEILKSRLTTWLAEHSEARGALDAAILAMNGLKGTPRNFDALEALLANQAYRLSFWRVAAEQINYRRFFEINDLAAIRIEEPEVLEAVHAKLFELMRGGLVTGLRVDHVDGLREPRQYLDSLAGRAGRPYVVVEKILTADERLPETWQCAGTTGYDFLNLLNGLFLWPAGEKPLRALCDRFRSVSAPYEDVVFESKRLVLQASMSSELSVLARRFERISEQHRWSRDFTVGTLGQVLIATIACFPVYRTYVSTGDVQVAAQDREHILLALTKAKRRSPGVNLSAFDFLGDVLLMRDPDGIDDTQRAERRDFVLRFQEITGPVMAKGVEDTAFFRYSPLLSLNEVGGGPEPFSTPLDAFHRKMAERARERPFAMSTTSTHDTKRAEDNRARLNAISEVAEEWVVNVEQWRTLAHGLKPRIGDVLAPDADDEYYIYQTLLGAVPEVEGGVLPGDFLPRVQGAVEKAIREAKRHTTWVNVDAPYEEATRVFLARLLDAKGRFLEKFLAFAASVRTAGYWNSLSQLVVKTTAPGVADFFQGSELWDSSMVDPDNRRPVDFAMRRQLLAELSTRGESDRHALIAELAQAPADGRIKLLLTQALLTSRRRHAALFLQGSYFPIGATGSRQDHVIAFARQLGNVFAVIVARRFFMQLGAGVPRMSGDVWKETTVRWPAAFADVEARDWVTGSVRRIDVPEPRLADLLDALPFCVLIGKTSGPSARG